MKKSALIAMLAAASVAFGCSQPAEQPQTIKEYKPAATGIVLEQRVTRELQILDVQPGVVSFGDFSGEVSFAIAHGFVYVIARDPEAELVLLYPHPAGIRRGIADITYKPLEGELSSEQFVRLFVNADQFSDLLTTRYVDFDKFPIEADGVIVKGGIKYK